MKIINRCLVLIAFLSLVTFGGLGCGDDANTPPDQAFVNQVLSQMVTNAGAIFVDFISGTTCAEIDVVANNYNNITQDCSPNTPGIAGTFGYSINPNPPTCSDGPPLTVSTTITTVMNNCPSSSVDTVYTGTTTTQISIFEETVTETVSSGDLSVTGVDFTISNLQLTHTNLTTCTGSMTANGFTCTVSSDCATCNF